MLASWATFANRTPATTPIVTRDACEQKPKLHPGTPVGMPKIRWIITPYSYKIMFSRQYVEKIKSGQHGQ